MIIKVKIFPGEHVKKERSVHRCAYLHHNDPYLKMGPFKIEIFMAKPFRSIFHDILTEREMAYLIDYSTPRLSHARVIPESNNQASKADFKSGKKGKTVAKTNQASYLLENLTLYQLEGKNFLH